MALRVISYAAWFILANVSLLAGCAQNPLRSTVPGWDENLTHQGQDESIDNSKKFLRDQQRRVAGAAIDASGQDWSQKEVALVGGLLAAAGQLASKTALLNTGLGVGTIALAANAFYQPREYTKHNLSALAEFNCLTRTAVQLSDEKRETALGVGDEEQRKDVLAAPRVLNESIDDALIRYTRAILELQPGKSSPADIQRFFRDFAEAADKQEQALKSANAARSEALRLRANASLLRQWATRLSTEHTAALNDWNKAIEEADRASAAAEDAGSNAKAKARDAAREKNEAANAAKAKAQAAEKYAVNADAAAITADTAAKAAEAAATAQEAAVPFIGLRTRLEACHKLT